MKIFNSHADVVASTRIIKFRNISPRVDDIRITFSFGCFERVIKLDENVLRVVDEKYFEDDDVNRDASHQHNTWRIFQVAFDGWLERRAAALGNMFTTTQE